MAELEGSSQKKRQGGFGLFKPSKSSRRSQRRSGSTAAPLPLNSQLSVQPSSYPAQTPNLPTFQDHGAQPTTAIGRSNNRKKRFNLFDWMFGQQSGRRSRRSQSRSGNSSQPGPLPPRLSRDGKAGRAHRPAAGDRRASRASSPTLPTLADPAQRSDRTLVPFPGSPPWSGSGTRRRRSPKTQVQGPAPTLMQQPTVLQQGTSLQSPEASAENGFAQQGVRVERRVLRDRRSRSTALALYMARMLILSIGVGVLAGTVLSAWNPGNTLFLADVSRQPVKQAASPAPTTRSSPAQFGLTTEITPLKAKLQTLIQQTPGFAPGLFLIDLDNYNYVDLSGSISFPAASMIKLPILVAFFQDVDAGKIRLDDKLTMSKEMIAQGSGEMQSQPPGTQFTALETATQMIIVSDNTATNMLIARLGGIEALNERFKSWGLTATSLKNVLPDLEGTNVASPKELASLMVRVSQGELVSMRSRDRLLSIMQRTMNNSQLPQGLGEGAMISHKTGDIGTLIGDVGLVDMPNGKRYAVAAMVKRPFNDDRAYDLVQKMSSTIYQHLNSTTKGGRSAAPTLSPAPTPSASPNAEESGAEPDAQRVPDSELNPPDGSHQDANPDQTSHP